MCPDNHHRRDDRDEGEGNDGGDTYVADDDYGGESDIYDIYCSKTQLRTSGKDDDGIDGEYLS